MVKKKIFGTLLTGISCLLMMGADNTPQRFEFEYLYLTPMHDRDDYKTRVLYRFLTNVGTPKGQYAYAYLINSKYPHGTKIKGFPCKNDDGTFIGELSSTLFLRNDSNTVRIHYLSEGHLIYHYFEEFFDDEHHSIRVDNLSECVYEAYNVLAYEKDRGNYTASNKYVFKNWYSENHLDVYNKFDISMFSFEEWIGNVKVPYESYAVQLGIPAIYGLFDDLTQEEIDSNLIVFDLDFVNDGTNHYTLKFRDKLYVFPMNYKMSRKKKRGYVQTQYMYLPQNGFGEFPKLEMSILGEKLGTMQLDFRYNFSLESNKSRIGDCVTSQYCVMTEDGKWSKLGKEIAHD